MAQLREKLWLLAIVLIMAFPLTHAGVPTIRFRGKGDSLQLGSDVILECMTDKRGEDLSGFAFQKFSPWLGTWITLDNTEQLRCWFYDVTINREDGHLLLSIINLQSWHSGSYRCVSSDVTLKPSEELELTIVSS